MVSLRIRTMGLAVALALAAWSQTPAQPGGTAAGTGAKPAEETKPQSPAEREAARLLKISEWARKTGASREQVQAAVFGPIIAGNQADADKNRDAALSFGQRADAAAKAGDAQGAKRLRAVSELFGECSKDNRSFLQAYKNGDMKGARDALIRLRAYDDRIAEIVGQHVPRSWYAHETMVATMGMTGEEIKRGFEQQFLGRTPPSTPGSTAAPQAQK
jgi:hypothetical protein